MLVEDKQSNYPLTEKSANLHKDIDTERVTILLKPTYRKNNLKWTFQKVIFFGSKHMVQSSVLQNSLAVV